MLVDTNRWPRWFGVGWVCLVAACSSPPATSPTDGVDLGVRVGADMGAVPSSYRFVVFGDTQPPVSSCTGNIPARMALPPAMADEKPAFVVHVGDLMDRGGDPAAYARFAQCYAGLVDHFPLFPTLGNHDDDWGRGIKNYKKYLEYQLVTKNPAVYGAAWSADFSLVVNDDPTVYSTDPRNPSPTDVVPSGVSNKTYYAFSFRNIAFISMEMALPDQANTPLPWLKTNLKKFNENNKIDHIFVFLHHPFYVTTMPEHDAWDGLARARGPYEALFRAHDVTAVWSGHAHIYEHSYVPDDGHTTRVPRPPGRYDHDGKAVHYVVTGGGSWAPNNCRPPPVERPEKSFRHTQARGCGTHFVVVDVAGKTVTVTVVGVTGDATSRSTTVWDRFAIR